MLNPCFKTRKLFPPWLQNHTDSFVWPPDMISALALILPLHSSCTHSPDTLCVATPPLHILFPLPAMLFMSSQTDPV